jgi:uncharacterized protein (TIGR02466 family)
MNVQPLYAVPLVTAEHPDAERVCPMLREFFLAREGDEFRDDIVRDTQVGEVFESRFDLFYWPDKELQPLVGFVNATLARTVMELNGYSQQQLNTFRFNYHAWYHITRTGGFQGTHNHPNASWSGIFCVDPGEPRKDPREGTVRFFDPRANADFYSDPGNQNLQAPFSHGGTQVTHQAGRLVIFPSYLMHEVFPYLGEKPRVIVAFNCWISTDQDRVGY